MRTLVVDATVTDLSSGLVPFLEGYTVVVINPTAAEQVLEGADENTPSAFETLATIPASSAAEVVLTPFIQVQDSAGSVILFGN